MNHKRGKPKKVRAGCLLCKPHKMNGENKLGALSKTGFGKIRRTRAAHQDELDYQQPKEAHHDGTDSGNH